MLPSITLNIALIATVPSLGDAIEAINYIHDDLAQSLKHFVDCGAELASRDHALANVPEVGSNVSR